jgi:hypothetical protein
MKAMLMLFMGGAVGSLLWFTLIKDVHLFRRELSQEERRAVYVGAEQRPKGAIKIQIANREKNCVKVTRADVDGRYVSVYYENVCSAPVDGQLVELTLKSPDGSVLGRDREQVNRLDNIPAGERGEIIFMITPDARAASLEITAKRYSE